MRQGIPSIYLDQIQTKKPSRLTNSIYLQRSLLDQIVSRFAKRSEAVEVLQDLLSLGKDAVYRRIRGTTYITPHEIQVIANHFSLSLDELLLQKTDKVIFSYTDFSYKIQTFYDWLSIVHRNMVKAYQLPEVKIYYASQELPIHLYCKFPKLLNFRAYMLGITSSWNFSYLQDKPFNFNLLPPATLELAKDFCSYYNAIPSVEIWDQGILNNTLKRIEYLATIDGFEHPETGLELCDELLCLTRYMNQMATAGCKFQNNVPSASFDLYHNEIMNTNNSIFVSSSIHDFLFTTYGNPNFLSSSDKKLCAFTDSWMQKVIAKSNAISKHSEKNRNAFFKTLERRILATRQRLVLLQELQ